MNGFNNVQDMIAARGEKVRMKAVEFGTVNGPYGILHTDPKGTDPLARNPVVWPEEAQVLITAGLATKVKTVTYEVDDDGNVAGEGNVLGARAAEKLGHVTDAHEQVGSTAALDSRQTTLYGDNRVSRGTVDETETGSDEEVDDGPIDDAPTSGSAPKNKGGRPRKDAAPKE